MRRVKKITKSIERSEVNLKESKFRRKESPMEIRNINEIQSLLLVQIIGIPSPSKTAGMRSPITIRYEVATPKHLIATARSIIILESDEEIL